MGKRSLSRAHVAGDSEPSLNNEVPETIHHLLPLGQTRVEKDSELCPGINCCALCARQPKAAGGAELVVCPKCERVSYCSAKHMKLDHAHKAVCHHLAYVKALEETELSIADIAEGIRDFFESTGSLEAYDALQGWDGTKLAAGANSERTGQRFKKSKVDESDAKLGESIKTAVRNAICSSYLSYPMTTLRIITTSPVIQSLLKHTTGPGPVFTVCVLGASEGAEVRFVESWSCLADAMPGCLNLQFVGPEVSSTLHNSSIALSGRVTACFWKGLYHELAEAVVASPELHKTPDVFVGFNTGLTCPDYDWSPTLDALERVFILKCNEAAKARTCTKVILPLILTTNTFVEGCMEDQLLKLRNWTPEMEWKCNPFISQEIMQSGTLANDLYQKNAWVATYVRTKDIEVAMREEKKAGLKSQVRNWLASLASTFGLASKSE